MAWALSRRLRLRGHEVLWTLLREAPAWPVEPGLDLVSGFAPGRRPVTAVGRLARRLRGAEGLYVLDHQNAVVLGALAATLARVRRRLVAVHTTGLTGGRPSLGPWFRRALGAYHAVLALSPEHARYLTTREGVRPERVRIVPNGIEPSRFRGGPGREEARRALGLPHDAEVVGTVAVFRAEKNLGLLLEAAARLRARRSRLRVLLVGDGPEREALQARARGGDLAGAVCFAGRRDDVHRLLPALDVFVLPSRPEVETQPLAVLEAMAAGVPVVTTPVGDLPSLLEQGAAGVLAAAEPQALADTIAALLDDAPRGRRLAARGRLVAEAHNLDVSASSLLRVLAED
jgi:glycosyltransferase involved in cell wall biosynthesis